MDYTTLAEVKTILGLTDSVDDARLTTLITAASRAIDAWCRRRFWTATETRRYSTVSPFWVPIDDAVNVTAVTIDQDGDGTPETPVPLDVLVLWPLNAPADGRPYTAIHLRPSAPVRFPLTLGAVAVTGTFGYAPTVPEPVAEACRLLVVRLYRRPQAPFGVLEPTLDGAMAAQIRADEDVRQLLAPYVAGKWLVV